MPKPKTSPDLTPKPYRLLKSDIAPKLSARSTSGITYVLLADTGDEPELHIAVTANEGGGLWSKEAVRLDSIEAVIDAYAGTPFPTKALRGAMVGRSSNNPPFCLAVLKDLGLVAPAPDKVHQHVKAGDWAAFRAEWLAKPGEPVIYPEPKPELGETGETVVAMPAEPATPEPPVTGKGKKRKKLLGEQAQEPMAEDIPETTPESDAYDGLDATDPTDGPTDMPTADACEADHAPTALA